TAVAAGLANGLLQGLSLMVAISRSGDVAKAHAFEWNARGREPAAQPAPYDRVAQPFHRRTNAAFLHPRRQAEQAQDGAARQVAVQVVGYIDAGVPAGVHLRQHQVGPAVEMRDVDPDAGLVADTKDLVHRIENAVRVVTTHVRHVDAVKRSDFPTQ